MRRNHSYVTMDEIVADLQPEKPTYGWRQRLARQHKVTPGFISQILHGLRRPNAMMLESLGYDPTPYYKKLGR